MIRRWAIKWDFVDQPGRRKIHQKPIALGGGIAIFIVVIVPLAVIIALAHYFNSNTSPSWLPEAITLHIPGLVSRTAELVALIAAATILHITGIIDDKRHLGPYTKLTIQLGAATLLATIGQVRFNIFIPNEVVTTILSVLWITIIINAFNFLDNMDGLSAGIAAICSTITLTAAITSGQVFVAGMLILLIGSLLGFLIFNFSPAKIFMGDAGSLIVGMLIAVATIRTTYYQQSEPNGQWFSTLMPLIILAVPLYDFISVTIIRLLQGASPFAGDKQHFSHRLVNRGMTQRQAVLTIYLATAAAGLGATLLPKLPTAQAGIIFAQTLLIILIIAILENPGKHLNNKSKT